MTETTDVESEDSGDREVTPVEVNRQTTDSQSNDVGTKSLNVKDDKEIADSLVERLLKTRVIKGQRFYWVKWAKKGKPSEWIAAKNIHGEKVDDFHKKFTLTGRKRRTNTRWKGVS